MSGILDKKSRILDFVLTENGRSQMENGDIRYKYATLSDKSIIYTKDHEKSYLKKSDVTNSEINYLPLEAPTSINDKINPEFDLRGFWLQRNINIPVNQNDPNSINFDNNINNYLTNFTLGSYLKNLNYLKSKNILNPDSSLTFLENNTTNKNWDFNEETSKYVTIKSLNVTKNKVPVMALDKRFSHKKNFSYMPPLDISGENLYESSSFNNIDDLDEDNKVGFIFSSYNRQVKEISLSSRKKEIINIINDLEDSSNLSLHKKEYEIENYSENETLLFNLYEVLPSSNEIHKLQFLNLGTFYDSKTSTNKKVYLIGKVFNTREKDDDFDLNNLFDFNTGVVNLDNENNVYTLSAYFSFICLFTLIIDQ